jgi:hypothetical protein
MVERAVRSLKTGASGEGRWVERISRGIPDISRKFPVLAGDLISAAQLRLS